jgi:hypothetical protein
MKLMRAMAMATLLFTLFATAAFADITGFIGANMTPANRPVVGGAFSVSLLVIGFEMEYAKTTIDLMSSAPSLQTGMGNLFIQNPIPIAGIQFYATAGGGLFREELGTDRTTNFGANSGGGAKIELISHVRLRIDYRVFKLAGNPKNPVPKRIYFGLSLGL